MPTPKYTMLLVLILVILSMVEFELDLNLKSIATSLYVPKETSSRLVYFYV